MNMPPFCRRTWGAAILFDLFRYKRKVVQDEQVNPMVAFLEADFKAVLSGELIEEAIGSSAAI